MIQEQLKYLIEDNQYEITILSNMSAFIMEMFDDISWSGFYLYQDNQLILGPFQGKVACTLIPMGQGVCGTSALKDETLVVNNVHEFEGHIACDSASNSEIVVPIHKNGTFYGVLDLDSTSFNRFEKDEDIFKSLVNVLENKLNTL